MLIDLNIEKSKEQDKEHSEEWLVNTNPVLVMVHGDE